MRPRPPFLATVHVPLFAGRFGICIADTLDDATRATRIFLRKHVEARDSCLAGALQHAGRFAFVCSRKQLKHGIIAHEIYHCTSNILGYSAVETTYRNDEAGAYLCDWLTSWTYTQLAKGKERIVGF